MNMAKRINACIEEIDAVVTSYNQGGMIKEAVQSLLRQTVKPRRIMIIDDGSTDERSLRVLDEIERTAELPVPISVCRQKNGGVSCARNAGIRKTQAPFVLVLDGDDKLEPTYIERVGSLLREKPAMVAASSWMRTFGVLDAVVCPSGGGLIPFLSRNCCPATHILKREAFEKCGGYDETMRSGFEDWDFFLSMLETENGAYIGMAEEALIHYRTAPLSCNVKSMDKRLELMRFIIEKHKSSYQKYVTEALLGVETISNARLYEWENEILYEMAQGREPGASSSGFIRNPSYGDGGMASAVRIVSLRNTWPSV